MSKARVNLAKDAVASVGKCLVLGNRMVSRRISGALQGLGFEVIDRSLFEDRIPHPSDADSTEKMKRFLMELKRKEGGDFRFLHPGVGVWAERPDLNMICQDLGVIEIAPPARVQSLFANRLTFLSEVDRLGIPHAVWSFDPVQSLREIMQLIEETRTRKKGVSPYPFVLKSIRGAGSSMSIRVIRNLSELKKILPLWTEQLRRCYGEAIFFLEDYIEGARHISLPFARKPDGKIRFFPLVDSSLQYHQRKIVEFCPAASVDASTEAELQTFTTKILDHSGFIGVGTLEFLVDGVRSFLIQGVPRLNTTYHLWEEVAETNAVDWQLYCLLGGEEPPSRTTQDLMVSAKIFAENPLLELPQPGIVAEVYDRHEWKFPFAKAELDIEIQPGEEIRTDSDGLIGVLWAKAKTKPNLLRAAHEIFRQTWIAGSLQTNERFVAELLAHPWVKEGMFHSGFIEEEFIPTLYPPDKIAEVMAGLCSLHEGEADLTKKAVGQDIRWMVSGKSYKAVQRLHPWVRGPSYHVMGEDKVLLGSVELSGHAYPICVYPLKNDRWQVRIGAWMSTVRKIMGPPAKTLDVCSLLNGKIHSILFQEGMIVPAHEPIAIVESLENLIPHSLPIDTEIIQWHVRAESHVQTGQALATVKKPITQPEHPPKDE